VDYGFTRPSMHTPIDTHIRKVQRVYEILDDQSDITNNLNEPLQCHPHSIRICTRTMNEISLKKRI